MTDMEIEAAHRRLSQRPISSTWFIALRELFQACNPDQKRWLRTQLGYGEPWPALSNQQWFGATWIERHPELLDPIHLRQAVANAASRDDARDAATGLCILYHLSILLGIDPEGLFSNAGAETKVAVASTLEAFLLRPISEQCLEHFGFEAVREPDGRVTIRCKG